MDDIRLLATQLKDAFIRTKMKLVAAESCTGGLVGHLITEIPGSSEYFIGDIIAYSYEAKARLLGVDWQTLERYGAVSQETALEMARGVRQLFAPDHPIEKLVGVAVSGIAGPDGGTPSKPVGLVWIALSTPDGDRAWQTVWSHDRAGNKLASSQAALALILAWMNDDLPEKI
ncbi:MAG: CinA family protein [Anaerolineae bacterium]|nr:CinA family protein [Anaerolineae bacterium]